MKRVLWPLGLLVVFVIFLLVKAPVWLVSDQVVKNVPGLELGGVDGSLWHGHVQSLNYQGITAQSLNWDLQVLGFLGGWPLTVSVEQPLTLQAELGLAENQQLKVRRLKANGDIAPLLIAAGLPTMGFEGQYSAMIDSAVLGPNGCQTVVGEFTVSGLRGDVDGIDMLGSIPAVLACRGNALQISIDGNNPAKVRGQLRIPFNGRVSGRVTLTPPPSSALHTSLQQFLGRPKNGKDFILSL